MCYYFIIKRDKIEKSPLPYFYCYIQLSSHYIFAPVLTFVYVLLELLELIFLNYIDLDRFRQSVVVPALFVADTL